jgi:predicted enzyme related to lactoylglutathione lyase
MCAIVSGHRGLEVLTGRWRTQGRVRAGDDERAARIDAVDTYRWLPGGFALLHTVDARVGDEKVEGAEIIGYDPARAAFITLYFGSDGPNRYEARLREQDGKLVWSMHSPRDRFTGIFSHDGETITGHWEQLDEGGGWQPWMDITLTRTPHEHPSRHQGTAVNRVLAGIAVADVDAAVRWYELLFGRPADQRPMEGLAEWHVPSGGVVQLVASDERAGRTLLTLDFEDLRRELAAMSDRGLDAGSVDETTSDKVLIAATTDPEGNAITLVQQR